MEVMQKMTKKLLIPDASNRAACINQLWEKLSMTCAPSPLREGIHDYLKEDLLARQTAPVVWALMSASSYDLDSAMALRQTLDEKTSAQMMRKAIGYAYWGRELDACLHKAGAQKSDGRDTNILTVISCQAISIACDSAWFATWVAPHLHNQFSAPGAEESRRLMHYSLDKPAIRFMALLQRSIVTGSWPDTVDEDALDGYGPLLAALAHPEQWPEALVRFCDWRVANAYGYPYMGAPKRRRQSEGWSVLDRESWEQVLPIELFILQFAYERATGVRVSLEADHPMLQNQLMTAPWPSLEPLYEDEWLQQAQALHAELYLDRFGLREPVPVLYP